ncbi:hypothetical protein K1T71_011980 [Dendrolimus kikuchii]|uniref:Uncharacterized protein n=1 Tax=Dendrolimus kikuchii TaxID=765133 RepID=A0ACC1CMT7_9NEOP|nr:hypothetical protein K1T71_011980 [Dendrolimus kikuchii]
MYHIPNQPLYHHNAYQECSLYCELKTHVPTAAEHNHFTTQHSVQANFTKPCESQVPSTPVKNSKKIVKSSNVDTSNFSIEERLVAAVWVHERKRTKSSINQIKNEFRQRFGRDPPAKNTLLVWERKLFSTGSVHDAPRSGRPVNR